MLRTILLLLPFLFFQCSNSKPKVEKTTNSAEIAKETVQNLPPQTDQQPLDIKEKPVSLAEQTDKKSNILGYFAYAADAAVFYPCGEKKAIPVVMEGDYKKMEQEYIRFKNLDFAEKIYAKVIGDYKMVAGMEGGKRKHLIVSEFLGFERGKKCN